MRKTRVLILAALLLCSIAGIAAAEDEGVWWGSYYTPGNFILSADIGVEYGTGILGIAVYPQAEMMLWKPAIPGGLGMLDVGAAVRGRVGYGTSAEDSGLAAGLGVLGTLHLGLRGLNFPWARYIEPLDYFIELGLGFDFIDYYDIGLKFLGGSGINYFLKPGFALTLRYFSWGGVSTTSVGVRLKFGPTPEIQAKDFAVEIRNIYYMAYLSQFYSLYWLAFYPGGFGFTDSSFKEGVGTRWQITTKDKDNTDSITVERALLKNNIDGTSWWKAVFLVDDDRLVYEFLIDKDYNLLKLRFRDLDSGELMEYNEATMEGWTAVPVNMVTEADYAEWNKGKEKVTVKAGSYNADHLVIKDTEDGYTYEWWLFAGVPGGLVKFLHSDEDGEYKGELIEITKGNTTELSSY